jgi:hypothetical protein
MSKSEGKTTTAIEEEPYKEEELEKLENLNGKSSQDKQLTRAEKPKKLKKVFKPRKYHSKTTTNGHPNQKEKRKC